MFLHSDVFIKMFTTHRMKTVTELLQSPLTMDYPEVEMQQRRGASSRGIWNPHEPAVAYSASFDHNVTAASTNLEACSTFLFPSSCSALVCPDSITGPALGVTGNSYNLQEFKNHPYCKTILEDHSEVRDTDQSRGGHELSFCTIDNSNHIIPGSMTMDPLQQAWLSSSRVSRRSAARAHIYAPAVILYCTNILMQSESSSLNNAWSQRAHYN